MKVKELIELLETFDREATIITQEYNGCNDAISEVENVFQIRANNKIPTWDDSTYTDIVGHDGVTKENVVYIR